MTNHSKAGWALLTFGASGVALLVSAMMLGPRRVEWGWPTALPFMLMTITLTSAGLYIHWMRQVERERHEARLRAATRRVGDR